MYQSIARKGVRQSAVAVYRRSLSTNGYLNETEIPTFHFQKSLPVLPLPKLEESLTRYLNSATPLISEESLAHTKALVDQFGREEGPALQQELERLMKTEFKGSSFISKFWFDKYLEDRACLPINYNPMITFKNDPDPAKMDQAVRAASLIYSSVAFFRTLRDGKLEPDIFHTKPEKSKNNSTFNKLVKMLPESLSWYGGYAAGAYALDMSQYDNLFQSTRLPGKVKDTIQTYPNSRHIVVQRGTDFFSFPVLTDSGDSVSHAEIEATIRNILNRKESSSPAVSLLTSMARGKWFDERQKLIADAKNMESLEAIDSAMFVVCLEDTAPEGNVSEARCMLHGDGRNRWYDKSFQLIVAQNGRSSVNFEHSWGDGVAVLRYFEEVYKESITQAPLASDQLPNPSPTLKTLEWNLGADVVKTIDDAGKTLDSMLASIHMEIIDTDAVYPRFLKDNGLGADGTFQMGFQLAHYKLHGFSASTYESASTSAFKHGRTETIRSATIESDTFCKLMSDASASKSDKDAALRLAVKNHGGLTKDALMGKGWDRHLFALRKVAERNGSSPALFSDETFAVLSNIILSTSTLSSPALDGGGFGPVGDECYGIMYGSNGDLSRFGVTSFRGESQTRDMAQSLDQSFNDIRELLAK